MVQDESSLIDVIWRKKKNWNGRIRRGETKTFIRTLSSLCCQNGGLKYCRVCCASSTQ